MNASHLAAGGGSGGFVAAIVVWVLARQHIDITREDAVVIGAASVALGTGLAHRIEKRGIRGLLTGLWRGEPDA